MIDYQDEEEKRINEDIKKQSGVDVRSFFRYEEVGTAFRINTVKL